MKAKLNNPALRDLGPVGEQGRQVYELLESLTFLLPVGEPGSMGGGGVVVEVPSGYRTDFASVPRILWPIFPPVGIYSRAAIVHDYLYTNDAGCSRFLADALFRELMAELGTPWWRRVVMYYAVRFFGGSAWRSA